MAVQNQYLISFNTDKSQYLQQSANFPIFAHRLLVPHHY